MSHTEFLNLLAKKMADDASSIELNQLQSLMKANPDWAYQAEQIQNLWLTNDDTGSLKSEYAFQQHLKRLEVAGIGFPSDEEVEHISPVLNKKRFLKISLIVVAAILVGFSIWISRDRTVLQSLPSKKYSEVSSAIGSKTKLILPDSTIVWLNSGSKLTYNEHFGITNRNTTLVGEAFFDVKKSSMPFIIHANTVQIKVLGTAFNVKAYPGEKNTETSLVRGRVQITLDQRPGELYILKPNEKLIVANEPDKIVLKPSEKMEPIAVLGNLTHLDDSTIIETSWVENRLMFEDELFSDVAKKMERWYGVSIAFSDQDVANNHVYGSFTTETIVEALDALKIGFHFNYKMEGKHITIASK